MSKRRANFQASQRVEKFDESIDSLVQNFKYINYGDNFDTSDTWEAARLLEQLPIFELSEELTNLNVEQEAKWTLAIKLTKEIAKIIFTAEECAGFMVDGTKDGFFCVNSAGDMVEMWRVLCVHEQTTDVKISVAILDQITEDFESLLGKFGDLSFIKSKPDTIPAPRVFEYASDEEERKK